MMNAETSRIASEMIVLFAAALIVSGSLTLLLQPYLARYAKTSIACTTSR